MRKRIHPLPTLLITLGLTACTLGFGNAATSTSTPSLAPVPLAASVNGEGITYAELDAEIGRYQQAQAGLGDTVSLETATQAVLENMINTHLLIQGAASAGYHLNETDLNSRIDALVSELGSAQALAVWQSEHGYTDEEFKTELGREMAAAWMRDKIIATVPTTAEQVHVKQILLYNADAAQEAHDYLQAGWKFEDLAAQYDPVTKGELGWFPRGYLPDAIVEQTAFALQPGEYSDVIQVGNAYEILYLVELDPARNLSPDALISLQERALLDWLTQERNASTIILAP